MSEQIKAILECSFKPRKESWDECDGYIIKTDKQEIKIGISNSQCCCEDWGYMTSQDNVSDFEGATLLGINVVDTAMNVKKWEEEHSFGLDCCEAMFVNVETDKGTFQITLYNAHNGYYGHSAYIESEQLNEERCL